VNIDKIESEVFKLLHKTDLFRSEPKLKNITGSYLKIIERLKEFPANIGFKNTNQLTFHRLDFEPAAGECPFFDSFIDRCTNGEKLMAYIGSILDEKSYMQEYLFLKGNGGDGKGTLSRFLEKILGRAFHVASDPSKYNQFYSSQFLGKRLAVYNDLNDKNLVKASWFKQFTGGDSVNIEFKGKDCFSAKTNTKFLLISNFKPSISSLASDQRRIIYCEISKFEGILDPSFEDRLWEERPVIIFKCLKAYEEISRKTGGPINDSNNMEILDLLEDNEIAFETIFNDYLELDIGSSVTPQEMHKATISECLKNGVQYKDFRDWVERKYNLKERKDKQGRKLMGLKLKKGFPQVNHPRHPLLT
ncbi:MAG: DUF5906 domain-containing protein, partial [Bacteriovoracaceae bacterium]